MKVFRPENLTDLETLGETAVTIGMFDGMHRGHLTVFEALRTHATAHDPPLRTVAITFNIHPKNITLGAAPPAITNLDHRLLLLERTGLDGVLVLEFDEELRSLTAPEFLQTWIADRLRAKVLVLGWDSKFGRDREGRYETIAPLAAALGIETHAVPPLVLHGRPVSSTVIREAVSLGDLQAARELLGRHPTLVCTVVPGDKRGRTLGFPTANLEPRGELLPPNGVYATRTVHAGKTYESVTNIGLRPTVADPEARDVRVEVHLLDTPWVDLYGERLQVAFLERLRGEQKFAGLEALKTAIRGDIQAAREIFEKYP